MVSTPGQGAFKQSSLTPACAPSGSTQGRCPACSAGKLWAAELGGDAEKGEFLHRVKGVEDSTAC